MSRFRSLLRKDIARFVGREIQVVYYARRYLSHANDKSVLVSVIDDNVDSDRMKKMIKGLQLSMLSAFSGAEKREVMMVSTQDNGLRPKDKSGQLLIFSEGYSTLRYGKGGIAPSKHTTPMDLLTESKQIKKGTISVIDLKSGVPFLLDSDSLDEVFVVADCDIKRVPSHEENIKRYSLNVVCDLPFDLDKRISIEIQRRIFSDRGNKKLHEEMTLPIYKPNEFNDSSATLIEFEERESGVVTSTPMHYSSGKSIFLIITTSKKAGVTLNFCGTDELPENRPDCEIDLEFEPNKIHILTFAEKVHNRFRGDFVCISINPEESEATIEAIKKGILPNGLLANAIIFSKDKKSEEKQDPEADISKAQVDKLANKDHSHSQ